MFTGLIQAKAQVLKINKDASGFILQLSKPDSFSSLKLGESISVNGVCLTLTHFSDSTMDFYVGKETLEKSNFKALEKPQSVNLERSLAFGDRLGGHLVSGHVDGVGQVVGVKSDGSCLALEIAINSSELKTIVPKGSLSVNGVSLTVNSIDRLNKTLSVYLIPETLERTNLSRLKVSDSVNIECDQFVKAIAEQVSQYMKEQNAQHS